jgi:hypothetical protein
LADSSKAQQVLTEVEQDLIMGLMRKEDKVQAEERQVPRIEEMMVGGVIKQETEFKF